MAVSQGFAPHGMTLQTVKVETLCTHFQSGNLLDCQEVAQNLLGP